MQERKGPYNIFPNGKYSGESIMNVIDNDPEYVIWCVMNFLDLTPGQAKYLGDKYNKEVPDRYIKLVEKDPEENDLKFRRYVNSLTYDQLEEMFNKDKGKGADGLPLYKYEKNLQLQKNR